MSFSAASGSRLKFSRIRSNAPPRSVAGCLLKLSMEAFNSSGNAPHCLPLSPYQKNLPSRFMAKALKPATALSAALSAEAFAVSRAAFCCSACVAPARPWQVQDARFLAVVRLFHGKSPFANALFRIYRLSCPEPVRVTTITLTGFSKRKV